MIRVTDDFIIDVDNYNYILKEDKHKKSKPDKDGNVFDVYDTIAYCDNLQNAIRRLVKEFSNRELAEGIHTLEEALQIVQKNNKKFSDLLEKAIEVEEN